MQFLYNITIFFKILQKNKKYFIDNFIFYSKITANKEYK